MLNFVEWGGFNMFQPSLSRPFLRVLGSAKAVLGMAEIQR